MLKNKKDMLTLGVISILLIAAVGYYFVLSPFLSQSSKHAAQMASAHDLLATAQNDLTLAQKYQDEYPSVLKIDSALVENFPTTADIESLNLAILLAASQAGIMPDQVTTISTSSPALMAPAPVAASTDKTATSTDATSTATPAPTDANATTASDAPVAPVDPAANSKMAQMSVTISIKGSPSALMAALTNLSAMNRVILITASSMATDGDGQAVLSVQAVSYLYSALDDPATKSNETKPVVGGSGSTATASPTPTPAP
jgi:Tfp pilus assembly protein PilO